MDNSQVLELILAKLQGMEEKIHGMESKIYGMEKKIETYNAPHCQDNFSAFLS